MNFQAAFRYPRQAEIRRTVKAARECGLDVAGIEVAPDGTIRILEARAVTAPSPTSYFDRVADKL